MKDKKCDRSRRSLNIDQKPRWSSCQWISSGRLCNASVVLDKFEVVVHEPPVGLSGFLGNLEPLQI